MDGIRRVLWRIGTTDAISWPTFWITFVAGTLGNILTNVGLVSGGLRLVVILLGQIALWIPLSIVGIVIRRTPDRSRPVLVLGGLLTGLLARTVLISAIIGSVLGAAEAKWSLRFVGGLVNIVPVFIWTAFIVNVMRERRRQIAALEAFQDDLEHSLELVSAGVVQRNQDTIERVRNVLIGELAALEAGDAQRSLAALQRTATEVVRPMSHELAQGLPDLTPASTPADPARISWVHVIDEAASGRPFRPLVTGLLMCLPVLGGVLIDPRALSSAIVTVVVVTGAFALANPLIAPLLTRSSLRGRIAAVVGATLLSAVTAGVIAAASLHFTEFSVAAGVGVAVAATTIGLGSVIITALGRDRDQVIRELTSSSRAVERNLVRWRQVQWFQQKALSRALHGPVQTAVNAAAIRLDAAMQQGPVSPEIIEHVHADLLRTLDVLNEPELTVASIDTGFARIVGTWDGICDVRVDVNQAATDELGSHAALRSCVLDIVTEAVGNAVRHGGATTVGIRATTDPVEETLRIFVESNGVAPSADAPRGLGSQLLDDCSLTWSRASGAHGHTLDVLLPLG